MKMQKSSLHVHTACSTRPERCSNLLHQVDLLARLSRASTITNNAFLHHFDLLSSSATAIHLPSEILLLHSRHLIPHIPCAWTFLAMQRAVVKSAGWTMSGRQHGAYLPDSSVGSVVTWAFWMVSQDRNIDSLSTGYQIRSVQCRVSQEN